MITAAHSEISGLYYRLIHLAGYIYFPVIPRVANVRIHPLDAAEEVGNPRSNNKSRWIIIIKENWGDVCNKNRGGAIAPSSFPVSVCLSVYCLNMLEPRRRAPCILQETFLPLNTNRPSGVPNSFSRPLICLAMCLRKSKFGSLSHASFVLVTLGRGLDCFVPWPGKPFLFNPLKMWASFHVTLSYLCKWSLKDKRRYAQWWS